MDLRVLEHNGDISAEEFRRLFQPRMGEEYLRAFSIFATLGELHSFSLANVLYLGCQKAIESTILIELEKWCDSVGFALRLGWVQAHVDTRLLFDQMYAEYFSEDTIDGIRIPPVQRGKPKKQEPVWVPWADHSDAKLIV